PGGFAILNLMRLLLLSFSIAYQSQVTGFFTHYIVNGVAQ
ncbi:MAG: hypothetical protein ACI892_002301, partial [Marinobacter maritimus]